MQGLSRYERLSRWLLKRPVWARYAITVLFTAALILVADASQGFTHVRHLVLLFIFGVAAAAFFMGTGPSLVSAGMFGLALQLVLIPEERKDAADVLLWLAFAATALFVGYQTTLLQRRAALSERAAAQAEWAAALAQELVAAEVAFSDGGTVPRAIAEHVRARSVLLLRCHGDEMHRWHGDDPSQAIRDAAARACALKSAFVPRVSPSLQNWAGDHPARIELLVDDAQEGEPTACIPLIAGGDCLGVLCFSGADPETFDVESALIAADLVTTYVRRMELRELATRHEAQIERERVRSAFVSSISHELKSPLAAIRAVASEHGTWASCLDSPEARKEFGLLQDATERLGRSIDDLLDATRLRADAWSTQFDSYEIGEILSSALTRHTALQRERIDFDVSDELPDVRCDLAQMARALGILIENGLTYSRHEKVTVHAAVDGEMMTVRVQDRGPGVSDADKERVFEPFVRGEMGDAIPGTGLGLSIAREIIEHNGGTVELLDAIGGGTVALVRVPLVKGNADHDAE